MLLIMTVDDPYWHYEIKNEGGYFRFKIPEKWFQELSKEKKYLGYKRYGTRREYTYKVPGDFREYLKRKLLLYRRAIPGGTCLAWELGKYIKR